MCMYTLQHTTTHCITVPQQCSCRHHTATRCNTLQHAATRCNTLQHTRNTLQHTATHCNTLQHSTSTMFLSSLAEVRNQAMNRSPATKSFSCVCVAVCCSVLQCVAVCCSVLQCVAVWYIHTGENPCCKSFTH